MHVDPDRFGCRCPVILYMPKTKGPLGEHSPNGPFFVPGPLRYDYVSHHR